MADTLFMIHGMWGKGRQWEKFIGFFQDRGYRCVAPTLPYHDVSPDSPPDPRLGRMSVLDYAQALEEEIRKLDTAPVIVGHSMGGLLTQILGARGLGKALVLLTPAAPRGIICIKPSVLLSFRSVLTTWGFWKKPMRQTFEEAVYSMLNTMPPDEQREVYSTFVYESGRAAFEIGFWLLDPSAATRVDASRVQCPVLVIAGGKDRITPASVVLQIAKKYGPLATYKEFPGCGHMVHIQPGWEDIALCVAEWLTEKSL